MTDKKKAVPQKLYKKVKWHGVKEVYQCSICEHCEDTQKRIEKHIPIHNKKEGTK